MALHRHQDRHSAYRSAFTPSGGDPARAASCDRGRYVFPSSRTPRGDRPKSNNAVLAALRRMGISKEEMTGHGFRAMARTILDEVLGFRPDFIEHQSAHAVRDPNGQAYNRTSYLPERRKMMQEWADYLDQLKADLEAVPIHPST